MTSRNLLVGMESYIPEEKGQLIDLHQGLWRPNFQFAGAYIDVNEVNLPFDGDSTIPKEVQDNLSNPTRDQMIVKALSFTWLPSYITQDYQRIFIRIDVYGDERKFRISSDWLGCPPQNAVESLIGWGSAVGPFVMRLARPQRLRQGHSIMVEVGLADDETAFLFSGINVANTPHYSFFGIGCQSRKPYVFSTPNSTAGKLSAVHQNEYDEDIDITGFSFARYDTAAHRPIAKVTIGDHAWSKSEKPFWVYLNPFNYGRFDLGYLPEGGLVLNPGERFDIRFAAPGTA